MTDLSSTLKPGLASSIDDKISAEYNRHRQPGLQATACYAPLKNLYFGHHGKIVACCYNRNYAMGTYPLQSIKEVWFGEKAEVLRQYLKAYNFSKGCEGCESQLLAKNFDAVKAKQYDGHRMNANRYPSVMEFELSNTCNLECVMCNGDFSSLIRKNREHGEALTDCYDREFVKQLEEFIPYLEEVKFYGGEPFLIGIYFDIWEKIIELNPGIRISVQTNGTILHKRVKDILRQSDFHITVSLDSLQKENYAGIRVNANLDNVLENVSYFNSYCKAQNSFFGISVCLMQQNWFEAPDFIRFANQLDIPVYFHTVWQPAHCALKNLPAARLQEIYQTLATQGAELPGNTTNEKKNREHYSGFLAQVYEWWQLAGRGEQLNSGEPVNNMIEYVVKETLASGSADDTSRRIKTTIRALPSVKLREIHQSLRPQFLQLPEGSQAEIKSKINFGRFLDELSEWASEAEREEQLHETGTLEKLIEFAVQKTFERTDLKEEEKKLKAEKLAANIKLLALYLPVEAHLKEALSNASIRNAQAFNSFLDSAETISVADAKHGFERWLGRV